MGGFKVTITNKGGTSQNVLVVAKPRFRSKTVSEQATLAPGEQKVFELSLVGFLKWPASELIPDSLPIILSDGQTYSGFLIKGSTSLDILATGNVLGASTSTVTK